GPRTEKFRYQIAGAHGTHLEGVWYIGTHRDPLILQVNRNDRERAERKKEDLRSVSYKGGGDEVTKGEGMLIRYGAVATQSFAAGVIVDGAQDFIARARPTVESAWIRGRIEKIDGHSIELDTTPEPGFFSGTPKKETHTVVLPADVQLPPGVGEKATVA